MHGDVWPFDRFAFLYDLFMPGVDPAKLREGLDVASRPVERVLDVGGGPGRAVRTLDVSLPVVVDPAAGMLEQAQKHGLECVRADGAETPIRTDAVDAVLVVDALHHVGDQQSLLSEVARVLRPGGVLVVREFDPRTLRGRALTTAEHVFGFESVFWPPARLAEMVADVGLTASILDGGFGYTVTGHAESGSSKSRGAV